MRPTSLHAVLAFLAFALAHDCLHAQTQSPANARAVTRAQPTKSTLTKKAHVRAPTLAQLEAQRKAAAKSAAHSATLRVSPHESSARRSAIAQNAQLSYTPASAPLPANLSAARARGAVIDAANLKPGAASSTNDSRAYASSPRTSVVLLAPTSIDANVLANLHEPLVATPIEMGDRPARGTSQCSDGRTRRLGDFDVKALAQNLPDFNVVRPRTVCVRRGVLMADYGFK
ncbi:MAG: hypothetical protein ACRDAM_03075 [Casimicrobium sp.]